MTHSFEIDQLANAPASGPFYAVYLVINGERVTDSVDTINSLDEFPATARELLELHGLEEGV